MRCERDGDADYSPAWSPDGTRIAFASNWDGDFEIYVMNPDGSGVVVLTHNSVLNRELGPQWMAGVGAVNRQA
jgi:TolB protein